MAGLFAAVWLLLLSSAAAHIEDVCFKPGKVQNAFRYTSALGCNYGQTGLRGKICELVMMLEFKQEGQFAYNTSCRGVVHFDSVYFMAAALGFKQEIAYWLAAFSQAPDHNEFAMFDSCGEAMAASWWTPPMKGLLRTLWAAGGSNMHFGLPFVGEQQPGRCRASAEGARLECPPLQQAEKELDHWPEKQRIARGSGCLIDGSTRSDFTTVSRQCPGLNFTLGGEAFYDGPLAAWKRWAFNQTDVLCNGGYTTLGPGGNPTTGSACPSGGVQYFGNIDKTVVAGLPMVGSLKLGEQIIDYDCEPSCACYLNCTNPEDNLNFKMVNETKVRMTPSGSSFGLFLREACGAKGRACMPHGGPVPELVARLGLLLHFYVDRASHWYCTDAPGTGVMLQRASGQDHEYDLVLYMSETCGVTIHGETHYWEQGMGMADDYLAPATVGALYQMYDVLAEFAGRFRAERAEWFSSAVTPMGAAEAIGTRERPGYLYDMVRHRRGSKRVEAHLRALQRAGLPPLPGWERDCHLREADDVPVDELAAALAERFRAEPDDCGLRALLKLAGGFWPEQGTPEGLAAQVAGSFDADGNGRLSATEVAAWERHEAVVSAYAQCDGSVVHI